MTARVRCRLARARCRGRLRAIGRKAPGVLEAFVRFDAEISVIAARGWNGDIAVYDVPEEPVMKITS